MCRIGRQTGALKRWPKCCNSCRRHKVNRQWVGRAKQPGSAGCNTDWNNILIITREIQFLIMIFMQTMPYRNTHWGRKVPHKIYFLTQKSIIFSRIFKICKISSFCVETGRWTHGFNKPLILSKLSKTLEKVKTMLTQFASSLDNIWCLGGIWWSHRINRHCCEIHQMYSTYNITHVMLYLKGVWVFARHLTEHTHNTAPLHACARGNRLLADEWFHNQSKQ